ncbi:quinol dehydrogenase ferredoxin subunit NapH [Castellaniella caeni]
MLRRLLHRRHYLLARRLAQAAVLLGFVVGPWFGLPVAHGTLASSRWFGAISLSDPLVVLQSVLAGHPLAHGALTGVVLVAAFYAVAGGRLFCGWVCPVNLVTDAAQGLRRRLGWRKASVLRIDKRLRYAVLGAVLLGSLLGGVIVWETINPINLIVRSLVFGLWLGGLIAMLAIFLFDFLLLSNGWCGHICPVGVFYGQLGRASVVRVAADKRDACNNCGDCFNYCPEPQVISPALRGIGGHDVFIQEPDCLRCGRCIDVCEQQVFSFAVGQVTLRRDSRPSQDGPE